MGSQIDPSFIIDGQPVSKQDMRRTWEQVRNELNHGGYIQVASASGTSRMVAEKLSEMVSVADFGAVGDGETDDTRALNAALHYLAEHGGSLAFEDRRVYLITGQLFINDASGWTIEGRHSKIKMADGIPSVGHTNILNIERCASFRIADLVVDGSRDGRALPESSVWAHNVMIRQCREFCFAHCRSIDAVMDGFYVIGSDSKTTDPKEFTKDGMFFECYADNCNRQGMSIINGWSLRVIGGAYTNTNGRKPESGIDIEANPGSAEPSNRDILIQGVRFTGNAGFGVEIIGIGNATDVTITGCVFEECSRGAIYMGGARTRIIANTIRHFSSSKRGLIDIEAGDTNDYCIIAENHFYGNEGLSGPLIYCHRVTKGHLIKDNLLEGENNSGIVCDADSSSVVGNQLSGNLGIAVEGSFSVVRDNRLSGCVSDPALWIAGASSVVEGNYFLDCKNDKGTLIVGGSQPLASVSRNILVLSKPDNRAVGIRMLKDAGSYIQLDNNEIGYG